MGTKMLRTSCIRLHMKTAICDQNQGFDSHDDSLLPIYFKFETSKFLLFLLFQTKRSSVSLLSSTTNTDSSCQTSYLSNALINLSCTTLNYIKQFSLILSLICVFQMSFFHGKTTHHHCNINFFNMSCPNNSKILMTKHR